MFLYTLDLIMWGLLVGVAVLFAVSGLDDFIFDLFYWIYYFYSKIKNKLTPQTITFDELVEVPEKRIAILLPCWQEVDVIESMLKHNLALMDYNNYDVFIGVYPNDPDTIKAIENVIPYYNNVHIVKSENLGPTSKANNLDSIYKYILCYEKKLKIKYEIFVLHDAEDVIHPLSLKLYNYIIPQKQMIQIPVFPLELKHKYWTHWTYADQFAEIHTKNLVVRSEFGAFVPSAGVGTALGTEAIQSLIKVNAGEPFFEGAFTEDYDSALKIFLKHGKEAFVSYKIPKIRKLKLFGISIVYKAYNIVATRSLFPMNMKAAVKQQSRWVYGIALQEWANLGWPGGFLTRYFLFNDRKAIFTYYFIGFGYIAFIYWLVKWIWSWYNPNVVTLVDFLEYSPYVMLLIYICTFFMLNRFLQRFIATSRIYGLWAGLLSIPRVVYANLLYFRIIIRAYKDFIFSIRTKKKIIWRKTKHEFPSDDQLEKYKLNVADILLEERVVNMHDIKEAEAEQATSHEKIGLILYKNHNVTMSQLLASLSRLYDLPIVHLAKSKLLSKTELKLSAADYKWLLKHHAYPVKLLKNNNLQVAFTDPGNAELKREIQRKLAHFEVSFALASYDHKRSATT